MSLSKGWTHYFRWDCINCPAIIPTCGQTWYQEQFLSLAWGIWERRLWPGSHLFSPAVRYLFGWGWGCWDMCFSGNKGYFFRVVFFFFFEPNTGVLHSNLNSTWRSIMWLIVSCTGSQALLYISFNWEPIKNRFLPETCPQAIVPLSWENTPGRPASKVSTFCPRESPQGTGDEQVQVVLGPLQEMLLQGRKGFPQWSPFGCLCPEEWSADDPVYLYLWLGLPY
jgi:hypothetical protein